MSSGRAQEPGGVPYIIPARIAPNSGVPASKWRLGVVSTGGVFVGFVLESLDAIFKNLNSQVKEFQGR